MSKIRKIMVIAFEGWNDVGMTSTNVIKRLSEHTQAENFLEFEPDEFFDFQFFRPELTWKDHKRALVWPSVVCKRGKHPSPSTEIVIVHCVEPSTQWRKFCSIIFDLAQEEKVQELIILSSIQDEVPHTRIFPVTITSENQNLQEKYSIEALDYEGTIGIAMVLNYLAEKIKIPSVLIQASVPHYVASPPVPKAELSQVRALASILGFPINHDDLIEATKDWEKKVNHLAEEDPEVSQYVQDLEKTMDRSKEQVSGESIAQAFEKYFDETEEN